MTPKALIVFNPQAGRGRGHKRAEEVRQALQAAGIGYESVVSEARGHAIELAQRAALAGWELVVAAGGDGTVNEVVNGLMLAEAEGASSGSEVSVAAVDTRPPDGHPGSWGDARRTQSGEQSGQRSRRGRSRVSSRRRRGRDRSRRACTVRLAR